jgi:arylsulfatase A-like enzyme
MALRMRIHAFLLPPLALVAPSCGGPEPEPAPTTNLVVVVLDTLRPDHLGCYGYPRPTSPNLDRFAGESAVFEQAQSSAPWTAPALLSLMTSLHPSVHQVHDFPNPGRMSEGVTTLAEVLKQAGYETAAFTEGGYAKGEFGLDQGFDLYPANEGDELSNVSNLTHPSRLASNLDRTIEWLRKPRERPFFLFFHTYEAHGPYRAPQEFVRRLRPSWDEEAEHARVRETIERWNATGEIDRDGLVLLEVHQHHCALDAQPPIEDEQGLRARLASLREEGAPFPPEVLAIVRDLYDAEIAYLDSELQRLWDALDEPGLARDTVVVVTSDHGEALGEHGRIGHGTVLHEELMRIVLLVRAPGVAAQSVGQLACSVDVMPTALELVGVPLPPVPLQGRSLAPLLSGSKLDVTFAYGTAVTRPGQEMSWHALRSGPWRYVADESEGRRWLFDLRSDPLEERDVLAERSEIAERLSALLDSRLRADQVLRRDVDAASKGELAPDVLHQLRGLGYLEQR